MRLLRLLNRLFNRPAWLTFLVMGIAAGGLALCSFNLLALFQANFSLLLTYGAMAAVRWGNHSADRTRRLELFGACLLCCVQGLPRGAAHAHPLRARIARLSIAPHPHLTRRPVPPS